MDSRLQFAGRYNKDASVDGLRVKLARRKSLNQKENRHNEFGKSRGLRLVDPNTSVLKSLHMVEELSETSLAQGHENSVVLDLGESCHKVRDLERNKQRYDMLQRYKEEKLLRKLKEQREKAQKGVFRCGLYKHDDNAPSLPSTKHTGKPKDKQAPPTTRITRSALKNEAPPPRNTRRQPITAGAGNVGSKASEAATRGHSQALNTAEKENHGLPPVRITRATAARVLPKNTNVAVIKPQKRNQKEPKPQEIPHDPEVASRIPVPEDKADEASEPMKSDSAPEPPRERIPSFAPENFTFQPLDGLCSYKLQPTTPATDRPQSFRWSPPHAPCDAMQEAPQDPIQVCEAQPPSCNEVTSPTWPPTAEECDVQTPAGEPQHDVPYFRAALKAEIQRLTLLCSQWDERIGTEIPDEAMDLIRTTVGQTRLLVAERFKQFEGLVDNCEFKRGEKETTCTDLDGFWDMVYFQIEDVIKKFANLVKLEENSWQLSTAQPNKAVKKRFAPVVKVNRGEQARAAARSRLASIKAAMKKGKVLEETPEAADQTPPADAVVFDAGFFRVESPAKRPAGVKPKCGSPQTSALCKSNTGTPRAAPAIDSVDGSDGGSRLTRTPGIKSPVGRTLFGDREEDGRTELESCEQSPRLAAKESELAKEENLVKLLVPPEECDLSFGSPKSFELVTHSHGETRIHSHILSAGEIEDEVFMSNTEEMEQQTHGNAPVPEDVQAAGHALDFLGTCRTPDMTPLTPLRFDAVAASSDLMVFSPLGENVGTDTRTL